jgi:hypothetical protein
MTGRLVRYERSEKGEQAASFPTTPYREEVHHG